MPRDVLPETRSVTLCFLDSDMYDDIDEMARACGITSTVDDFEHQSYALQSSYEGYSNEDFSEYADGISFEQQSSAPQSGYGGYSTENWSEYADGNDFQHPSYALQSGYGGSHLYSTENFSEHVDGEEVDEFEVGPQSGYSRGSNPRNMHGIRLRPVSELRKQICSQRY